MSWLRKLDFGRLSILAVLLIGAVAFITKDQWDWLLADGSVKSTGVTAPTIDDVDQQTEDLYRISNRSTATYTVEEKVAGSSRTTSGLTTALAGDIVVDLVDPAASRVGLIVVNVEMFESDSNLRDKRIRHDFLESTKFPFARFATTSLDGLPDEIVEGVAYSLTITGDLTVKETTAPVSFTGPVNVSGGVLTAEMTAEILMSEFDVGPISIAGLVNTSDELTLGLNLVADRVAPGSAADEPEAFDPVAAVPPGGEFAATVMPILEKSCVSCHTSGASGSSTFLLDTAAHASEVAEDIALVTEARYMPPWTASDRSLEFSHDWSLDDDELATLAGWASAGGGLDVAPDTKLVADPTKVRTVQRDVVSRAEPYVGDLAQQDDYRCQVFEVGDVSTDRFIKAFTFEADKVAVVHHAVTFAAPGSSRLSAEVLELQDDAPGWACFGLSSVRDATQIAAWAPGMQPTEFPEGSAIHLDPDGFLIVQIHYHYDDDVPADQSAMVVDLASDDEIANAGGSLAPVDFLLYLAPAEIPCTADQTGPLCDRSVLMAELEEQYGEFAVRIPDGLLFLCGQSLDQYIDDTDGVVTSTCDHGVGNPGRIVSVWGHMHEIGVSFTMTLNPDTPDEQVLLDIPTWSFEWQLDYQPIDDVVLTASDTVRVSCTWDRSLGFQNEPRYITWNEGTLDEMCYSSIATVPSDG